MIGSKNYNYELMNLSYVITKTTISIIYVNKRIEINNDSFVK